VRQGGFQRDLSRLVDTSRPVALVRFGDGEYHLLNSEAYAARSGWTLARPSWIRERLRASLVASLPNYWVGISPPCDWPLGTAYYRPLVKAHKTFATVFSHANYHAFRQMVAPKGPLAGACIVGPGKKADHQVPLDGVNRKWDLDGLVDRLLSETRPILVAAGPCACVVVHEYWRRCPDGDRQTILDVGAAIDPILHGKETRDFHQSDSPLRFHACNWDKSAPWAPSAQRKKKKKTRGYAGYLARQPQKQGAKRK
jgi:hypothetical protein